MKTRMLLPLLISAVLLGALCAEAASAVVAPVRSYKEWKGEKIQAALSQILSTRNLILKSHAEKNLKLVESFQKQLSQLQWNLEVANDLSVTDYFVLYLSQQTQPDRFQLAAQKLIPSEVAELMEAYSNALGISSGATQATTALSPSVTSGNLTKIPSQATKN